MAKSKTKAVRREEILDAAEELFVTKGYEQATTVDIMQKVGIAKGTLYYHFTSKEEILDALIERARSFDASGAGGVHSFLAFMDDAAEAADLGASQTVTANVVVRPP